MRKNLNHEIFIKEWSFVVRLLKRIPHFLLLTLIVQLLLSTSLYAGVIGKISGVIKDSETGDPLPGANIIVDGTNRGAAADADGRYLILNMQPGNYTLRVQMIGYQTVRVTDVKVYSDRITKIDCELSLTVLEGQEVTVVAGREPVEFDRTNTASYVRQEEIDALPVTTVADIVQLQAGVVTDASGGLHFRGGRTREVAYMIDGIPVTNTFSQSGGSNVSVETNFIKELQVITGTFNAEYGSAQSGVINMVTKVPEDKFKGTLELLTGGYYSPNSPQYIGLDSFDSMWNDEQELKFSLSIPIKLLPEKYGRLGFLVNGRLQNSNGWLNGENRYKPEDGWEIEVYREWYNATYDPEDPLVIPLPDSLHTGDGSLVNMEWEDKYNINTKLVYQPIPSITASYSIFYNNGNGRTFSNSWKFCPEGRPSYYDENISHMFVFTHSPFENIFYNLRYSHQITHEKNYTYENPNDPRYQITAVNAWDPGANTGYDMGGTSSWNRRWFDQKVNLLSGDVTWQINKLIEIKTGFEARHTDLHYKNAPMREELGYEILQFPYTRTEIRGLELPYNFFKEEMANYEYGTIKLRETHPDSTADDLYYVNYNRQPIEAAGYMQTRLAMGEIILNAGLRMEYFWPKDRYCPDYTIVYPEFVGADEYYIRAKNKIHISPRFGLSFPISEKGALRLSYGHFYQNPSYEKMYENPVLRHYNQFSIVNTTIGNPNLKAEKTIQYEIGLQQELQDGLSTELSVYYKDIRDLLGVEILTLSNATTFNRYINKEYGNSSGITLSMNYRSQDGKLTTNIDYTYMISKGTSSDPSVAQQVAILSGPGAGAYTLAEKRIDYLNWDQTHSLNGSVSLRPLPDWYVSIIGQLGSGLPYSPATLDQSIEIPGGWWDNAGRKPFSWNVDLKIAKTLKIMGLDCSAFFNIYNIFNHLNEDRVHAYTGHAGPNAYLPESGRLRYSRIDQLGEFTHDEADYDPEMYSRPRLIQLGLNFGF